MMATTEAARGVVRDAFKLQMEPKPLVVFEAADRAAKDFIGERIEHMMAHLEYAMRITALTGDNVSMLHEALSRAGMEFKAVRETMGDILARRKDGARDMVKP